MSWSQHSGDIKNKLTFMRVSSLNSWWHGSYLGMLVIRLYTILYG